MWERADGGYRILDWEAVEYALDLVRQRTGEDPLALAADREHEAKIQAHMAKPMVVTPPCAACRAPAAHIELVAPGQLPAGCDQWPSTVQGSILRRRQPGQWYLLVQGIATRNGYGDSIDASHAGRIAWAFRPPLRFAQVHTARLHDDAGFCQDCEVPYCHQHWRLSDTGYGYCPYGHGKRPGPALVAVSSQSPDAPDQSDLLGVNEVHEGRQWSLPQVESLLWSHEVGAGRIGCCTHLLYPADWPLPVSRDSRSSQGQESASAAPRLPVCAVPYCW